jgi:hypothetical protein
VVLARGLKLSSAVSQTTRLQPLSPRRPERRQAVGGAGARAGRDLANTPRIVDAKALPVAKGKRADGVECLGASKGFSTMEPVYGFKPHALVNALGPFERWSFAPAHHHEASLAPELVEGIDAPIIGDKAYLGNAEIVTPKRKNMTEPSLWRQTLGRLRKRIENNFSVLVGSLSSTLHEIC